MTKMNTNKQFKFSPEQLEQIAKKICPFIRTNESLHSGIYMLAGDDEITYLCGVDGGIARGGQLRRSIPRGASTPCSLEYAKTCSLYLNNRDN